MNNVIVYCEIEDGNIVDVSLELLTKGRSLADLLKVQLDAVVIGKDLKGIEHQVYPFGVDNLYVAEDPRLYPYQTLPHASIVSKLFKDIKPEIAIFGATSNWA